MLQLQLLLHPCSLSAFLFAGFPNCMVFQLYIFIALCRLYFSCFSPLPSLFSTVGRVLAGFHLPAHGQDAFVVQNRTLCLNTAVSCSLKPHTHKDQKLELPFGWKCENFLDPFPCGF